MISHRDLLDALSPLIERIRALEVREATPTTIIVATKVGTQSIPSGGWTPVTLTEVTDTDDQFDDATDRITITVPGYYLIAAQTIFEGTAAGGAGQEERGIRLNGPIIALGGMGATTDPAVDQSVILPVTVQHLSEGSAFLLEARQESGGPLLINTDDGTTWLIAICLRRADEAI